MATTSETVTLQAPADICEREIDETIATKSPLTFTWLDQPVDLQDLAIVEDGWETPIIEMWTTDRAVPARVGYLKVSTLKAEQVTACRNDIITWLVTRKGWCFDVDTVQSVWQGIRSYTNLPPSGAGANVRSWNFDADSYMVAATETALQADIDHWKTVLDERYRDERACQLATISNYFVAVSRISKTLQRQGHGVRMYETMARELAQRHNAPLYSSALQSDQAKKLWAHLKRTNEHYRSEQTSAGTTVALLDYR